MKAMTLILSSIAAVSSFSVAFSPAASAYERKESAFICFVAAGDGGEMDVDASTGGVRNQSSGWNWAQRQLYCPIVVDDANPINTMNLEVNGRDGDVGAAVWAQACLSWRWDNGGFCGASVANGGPGAVGWYNLSFTSTTMNDPLYYWHNFPWDYPYVVVSLPGNGGSGSVGYPSGVSGLRIFN